MREFEKWFSEDGSIIPMLGDAGYEGFLERKKSWKAALEKILSQLKRPIYSANIMKWIEEELKNGNS